VALANASLDIAFHDTLINSIMPFNKPHSDIEALKQFFLGLLDPCGLTQRVGRPQEVPGLIRVRPGSRQAARLIISNR
jgi:hypothetical protein